MLGGRQGGKGGIGGEVRFATQNLTHDTKNTNGLPGDCQNCLDLIEGFLIKPQFFLFQLENLHPPVDGLPRISQSKHGYSELLYAHLLDGEGQRLTYTHFTAKVRTKN